MRTPTLLIAAAFVLLAPTANAMSLSIDGSNCGSCAGSDLFLEILDNNDGSFGVTLIINTDDYFGTKDGMAQAGFGGIKDWASVVLDSGPAGSALPWEMPIEANISSAGLCKNGGNTGKVCTSGFIDIGGGGDHKWEFTGTGGTLKSDTAGWHIGGQYADLADLAAPESNGKKKKKGPIADLATLSGAGGGTPRGNIISESGGSPAVPEPNSALLFGIGALVASRVRRRG